MARYATTEDMIARFGEVEMVHLTAPDGQVDDVVVLPRAERALDDASALIDSYLRVRYAVPLAAPIPPEVARAACILARYDLAHGEQRDPTEQMRLGRKEVLDWLRAIADGAALLDGATPAAAAPAAGARVVDRPPAFTNASLASW